MIKPIIKILTELLKRYWKIFLIVGCAIYIYILSGDLREAKETAIRNKNNFEQLLNKPNSNIETLTAKEFKRLHSGLLDSIRKYVDKSIKAKNITNITNIKEYYIDSTKNYYSAKPLPIAGVFDISYKDKCWGFSGEFNANDTTTSITDKYFKNDISTVVYWKRDKWFNSKIKFMPNWFMPKKYHLESFDKCNSSLKSTNIKLLKKQ